MKKLATLCGGMAQGARRFFLWNHTGEILQFYLLQWLSTLLFYHIESLKNGPFLVRAQSSQPILKNYQNGTF
jgi:hypothetical protein